MPEYNLPPYEHGGSGMFGLIPTEGYSSEFLIASGIAVLTLSFAIGCVTDMVMRESGFGPWATVC